MRASASYPVTLVLLSIAIAPLSPYSGSKVHTLNHIAALVTPILNAPVSTAETNVNRGRTLCDNAPTLPILTCVQPFDVPYSTDRTCVASPAGMTPHMYSSANVHAASWSETLKKWRLIPWATTKLANYSFFPAGYRGPRVLGSHMPSSDPFKPANDNNKNEGKQSRKFLRQPQTYV